jgi:thioredoxin reductase (NADPH)
MPTEAPLDLLVVGAGPAGLSAACTARECGLTCLVLERGRIAQTIRDYPLGKPLHSPAQDVELLWGELHSPDPRFAGRAEVVAHYDAFAAGLDIRSGESVHTLVRSARGIRVHSSLASYEARHVLVATGGFGIPRRLEVPGETEARVSYRFRDAGPYAGKPVLVVGGGNSAAEAALWLHQAAARVTLSLRRPSFAPRGGTRDAFTSVKTYNSDRLEALAARGELQILFNSQVVELTPGAAVLRAQEQSHAIACDHVFALLGAEPDTTLLRGVGAEIAADRRPVYHPESYETTVPGVFVAGHLTRAVHLTPAIAVPRRIVRRIAGQPASARGAGWLGSGLAAAAKAARKRSALARSLVRALPWLRRAVQRVEAANVMRDSRPSLARRLIRQNPRLHRVVRRLRAFAAP